MLFLNKENSHVFYFEEKMFTKEIKDGRESPLKPSFPIYQLLFPAQVIFHTHNLLFPMHQLFFQCISYLFPMHQFVFPHISYLFPFISLFSHTSDTFSHTSVTFPTHQLLFFIYQLLFYLFSNLDIDIFTFSHIRRMVLICLIAVFIFPKSGFLLNIYLALLTSSNIYKMKSNFSKYCLIFLKWGFCIEFKQ